MKKRVTSQKGTTICHCATRRVAPTKSAPISERLINAKKAGSQNFFEKLQIKQQKILWYSLLIAMLLLALFLRSAGLFRGLDVGYIYHPDESKQVSALYNYLNNSYVWYVGNPFYDGYPYGLNHIDEWLIRPVLILKNAIYSHLLPETRFQNPTMWDLLFWARTLRVLYGVFVVFMAYAISKRIFSPRWAALLTVLCLAIAPVSIAVSHFATGDIGVDLFTVLMLFFLCCYAKKGLKVYLFAAAFSVGMAFACKYNGMLAGGALGIYLLLEFSIYKRIKQIALKGGMLFAGIVTGAIAGTPACLINWNRTWEDVWINFSFIKNYGVSAEFIKLPFRQRVVEGVANNFSLVMQSLGWMIVVAALSGLVLSALQFANIFRSENSKKKNFSIDMLRLSIFSFPFAALTISLIMKPEVQPFHFSFLQIPLTLSAVYCIYWLWSSPKPLVRIVSVVLVAIIVLELGTKTEHECFLWSREDNQYLYQAMADNIFTNPKAGKQQGVIKSIILESPDNPAVFRNRKKTVSGSNARFWNEIHIAPVPTIPYPVNHDWIFMNGPVFPRNDRMVRLEGETKSSRQLVFHNPPETITIGVRSGSWPTKVALELGGQTRTIALAPNSQKVISITPRKWRTIRLRKIADHDLYFVTAQINASLGAAVVTFMTDPRQIDFFRLFGGHSSQPLAQIIIKKTPNEVEDAIGQTRYIEKSYPEGFIVTAGNNDLSTRIIPTQSSPLPAGNYTFECSITGLNDKNRLSFEMVDELQLNTAGRVFEIMVVEKGRHLIRFSFDKSFAPYFCRWKLVCLEGNCRLHYWRIKPNAMAILSDLEKLDKAGIYPPWLNNTVDDAKQQNKALNIVFGNKFKLKEFIAPPSVKVGEELRIRCAIELRDFNVKNFENHHLILHFFDKNGRQVYATQCYLLHAAASLNNNAKIGFGCMPSIPVGQYIIKLGVLDDLAQRRLSVTGSIKEGEISHNRISVGEIEIR